MKSNQNLKEVALLFLKLGFTAFGGPAAHIAMMEEEVVEKRKWMTREHFLDLMGMTQLIPGPNSTEMAIHCGYCRAGWLGLITAGVCFISPAVLLTMILAYFYMEYGSLSYIEPFFFGIRPIVLALIMSAILKLGKKSLKNMELGLIGCAVIVSVLLGVREVLAILIGGVVGMMLLYSKNKKNQKSLFGFMPLSLLYQNSNPMLLTVLATVDKSTIELSKLFLIFLKIGLILFGSGYVLFAYLQGELVENLQWITQQDLLDAIAMGQFTPGPVLSTAAFIGYQVQGIKGSLLASLGIFLPSFFLVALLNPIIPQLRKSKWTSCFLDAVNVSAVGVMVAVVIKMGQKIIVDWKMLVISLIGIICVLFFKKVNSVGLLVIGSLSGWLLYSL